MALHTSIEWTQSTWNPLTGCTKVSPGCKNCYAERMAQRLKLMGQVNYTNGFRLTTHETALALPLKWKTPQNVFVNSMSDLFHEDVPVSFILAVFATMRNAHWHSFQVLTKRSQRLRELNKLLSWPPNVWMGVSVEDEEHAYRVDDLRATSAQVKFLSLEPLLGPIHELDVRDIDWVIVGGESGPGARPMDSSWVLEIRDCCLNARVPFFFKQWGGTNRKKSGRMLDGQIWSEMPSGGHTHSGRNTN